MKRILLLTLFNFILANPASWQEYPSGGSPMPISLIIIGTIFLYIWLKSEL